MQELSGHLLHFFAAVNTIHTWRNKCSRDAADKNTVAVQTATYHSW